MIKKNIPLLFILILLGAAFETHAQCWEGSVEKVLDGNTLLVTRQKSSQTIQMYGIDAPVADKKQAFKAKKELKALVLNRKVTVCPKKVSRGLAAEVFVLKGFMLSVNQEMVRKGHAKSTIALYQGLEKKAREKRLGLWSNDRFIVSKDDGSTNVGSFPGAKNKADQYAESNVAGGLSVYTVTPSTKKDREDDNNTQERALLNEKRQAELDAVRAKQRKRIDDDSQSYTDIDHVGIRSTYRQSGYKENGILEIVFKYTREDSGSRVYWDDGDVNCDCSVLGHFSEGTNTRIARTSLILNSSSDRAFIDIPYKYFDDSFIELNSVTVECRLSTGMFDLQASDKVYLKFTGRPRLYPRPRHY